MDWMTFISSMVGSLAWPTFVGILLILLRPHLTTLFKRLDKISVPWLGDVSFAEGLQEAREKSEQILVESKQIDTDEDDESTRAKEFNLAQSFPEAAVIEAFKELAEVLLGNKDKLVSSTKGRGLLSYVRALYEQQALDENSVMLFEKLQRLRNLAVHSRGATRITPAEAIEYQEQCEVLLDKLKTAFDSLSPKG